MSTIGSNSKNIYSLPNNKQNFIEASQMRTNRSVHNKFSISIIIFSFLIFVAHLVFQYFVNVKRIFGVTIAEVSENPKYKLLIMPASRTFLIWIVIYSMLFLLHIYSCANICRRGKVAYLYQSQGLLSRKTLLQLAASYTISTAWIILFVMHDKLHSLAYAAAALFVLALNNYITLICAQSWNREALIQNTSPLPIFSRKENILYQIIVINSIALYFGWTLIAADLGIGIAIQEYLLDKYYFIDDNSSSSSSMTPPDTPENRRKEFELKKLASQITTLLIASSITLYAISDFSTLNRSSFTILQYVAFLVALIGIYYNKMPNDSQSLSASKFSIATSSSSESTSSSSDSTTVAGKTPIFVKIEYVIILMDIVAIYAAVKLIVAIISCIKYSRKRM